MKKKTGFTLGIRTPLAFGSPHMNRHAIPDIDLRQRLAQEKGLECHLLVGASGNHHETFPELLCAELQSLLYAAYAQSVTVEHFRLETWAVTLRRIEAPHDILACSTLTFYSDFPSYFHSHFEAVHPDHQREGLGRLLYDCLAVWARFLVPCDPLVLDGVMRSEGDYCLVSTIDRDSCDTDSDSDNDDIREADEEEHDDNLSGHGAFLKSLGFVRALHDFRQNNSKEIAFQRAFHAPIDQWFPSGSDQSP
jgi:GNAT superfamily N-acetyltransferase